MHHRYWLKTLLTTSALIGLCASMIVQAAGQDHPDWHLTVRQFAQLHFKNPAWGYSHNERDYDLARSLAASDHVKLDDDVLFAAAYLHDIAAFAPWGGDEPPDHSDVGADAVESILKDTGFPMGKLPAVREAIRTHMYYRRPVGPEAVYLHDADALDWLGAIGATRIIALVDPNGGDPDGPKSLKMLEDNLNKVPSEVVSPAARAMVGPRVAELKQFLAQLKQETADFREL